jgi:hypothetical protein
MLCMKTFTLLAMLFGATSAAQAQDFRISGAPAAAPSARCSQLSAEAVSVQSRSTSAESALGGHRVSLEQVEARLAGGSLAPEQLVELLELRLSLWHSIRSGELALYGMSTEARMVGSQLHAAGCR